MEFACSVCGYTSLKKENITKHFNRKTSCGLGIKEIVEIPVDIKCQYCQKDFASSTSLKYHQKNSCKSRNIIMQKEINELKLKIRELEKAKDNKNQTYNIINNNQTINNIVIVNNYEDTKLDRLTDNDINKILEESEEPYHIIPRLIKEVHFNPNIPENHNIFLSNRNRNNKHLQVYRNKRWEIENKNTEIDNLINDKETNLSDWVAEKGDEYPEAQEKFTEYLDQKFDEDTAKQIKEQVELVLYNNRHMIKKPVN